MCGIGGRTIEEAKSNISYSEFLAWCGYRNKYGSLHLGMRLDRSVARSTAFFGNMMSGKKSLKMQDFSPNDQEQETLGSIEDVFGLLSGKHGVTKNGK